MAFRSEWFKIMRVTANITMSFKVMLGIPIASPFALICFLRFISAVASKVW